MRTLELRTDGQTDILDPFALHFTSFSFRAPGTTMAAVDGVIQPVVAVVVRAFSVGPTYMRPCGCLSSDETTSSHHRLQGPHIPCVTEREARGKEEQEEQEDELLLLYL